MTCGIYLLKFKGTEKVYIGQSKHIEKRFVQHKHAMLNKYCSPKLLEAYTSFGEPDLVIITECSASELDELEEAAIEVWDSVLNGFNTYSFANQAPTGSGYGIGNTKYPKYKIVECFEYLVKYPQKTFKQIEAITGVLESTIANISAGKSHLWLMDDYPKEYSLLKNLSANRKKLIATTIVSDKLSAKAKGIVYPPIKSPEGEIFYIDNAYKFAKSRGLAPNHFQEVLNGHRKSHKGWKLCHDAVQL